MTNFSFGFVPLFIPSPKLKKKKKKKTEREKAVRYNESSMRKQ